MASTSEIAEVELGVHEEAIDEVNATGDVTGFAVVNAMRNQNAPISLVLKVHSCKQPTGQNLNGLYCRVLVEQEGLETCVHLTARSSTSRASGIIEWGDEFDIKDLFPGAVVRFEVWDEASEGCDKFMGEVSVARDTLWKHRDVLETSGVEQDLDLETNVSKNYAPASGALKVWWRVRDNVGKGDLWKKPSLEKALVHKGKSRPWDHTTNIPYKPRGLQSSFLLDGQLGEGIALWMRFVRDMALLFSFLFLLNVPAFMLYVQRSGLTEAQGKPLQGNAVLATPSLGNLFSPAQVVANMDAEKLGKGDTIKVTIFGRELELSLLLIAVLLPSLDLLGVVVFIMFLARLRLLQERQKQAIDKKTKTIADYSIMVTGIFGKGVEKEAVRQYFQEFGEVEGVCFATYNEVFLTCKQKSAHINDAIGIVEAKVAKARQNAKDRNKTAPVFWVHDIEAPDSKAILASRKTSFLSLVFEIEANRKMLDKLTLDLERLGAQCDDVYAAFVTFSDEKSRRACLDSVSFRDRIPCIGRNGDSRMKTATIREAPEVSNVFWEHLPYGGTNRLLRSGAINVLAVILLAASFVMILFAQIYQRQNPLPSCPPRLIDSDRDLTAKAYFSNSAERMWGPGIRNKGLQKVLADASFEEFGVCEGGVSDGLHCSSDDDCAGIEGWAICRKYNLQCSYMSQLQRVEEQGSFSDMSQADRAKILSEHFVREDNGLVAESGHELSQLVLWDEMGLPPMCNQQLFVLDQLVRPAKNSSMERIEFNYTYDEAKYTSDHMNTSSGELSTNACLRNRAQDVECRMPPAECSGWPGCNHSRWPTCTNSSRPINDTRCQEILVVRSWNAHNSTMQVETINRPRREDMQLCVAQGSATCIRKIIVQYETVDRDFVAVPVYSEPICTRYKQLCAQCFCLDTIKDFWVVWMFSLSPGYSALCSSQFSRVVREYSIFIGAAVSVTGVNLLLKLVLRKFSGFEKHHTKSNEEKSIAIKIFAAQFFNTAFVPLLVYAKISQLSETVCHNGPGVYVSSNASTVGFNGMPCRPSANECAGDGVCRSALPDYFPIFNGEFNDFESLWYSTVGTSILITVMVNTVLTLQPLVIDYPLQWLKEKVFAPWLSVTQRQLNSAFEGPEFELAARYGVILNNIFSCMLYSAGSPVFYLVAAAACGLTYIVDKVCLHYLYKTPTRYNDSLAKVTVQILPAAAFLHLIFGIWKYSSLMPLFPVSEAITSSLSAAVTKACESAKESDPYLCAWTCDGNRDRKCAYIAGERLVINGTICEREGWGACVGKFADPTLRNFNLQARLFTWSTFPSLVVALMFVIFYVLRVLLMNPVVRPLMRRCCRSCVTTNFMKTMGLDEDEDDGIRYTEALALSEHSPTKKKQSMRDPPLLDDHDGNTKSHIHWNGPLVYDITKLSSYRDAFADLMLSSLSTCNEDTVVGDADNIWLSSAALTAIRQRLSITNSSPMQVCDANELILSPAPSARVQPCDKVAATPSATTAGWAETEANIGDGKDGRAVLNIDSDEVCLAKLEVSTDLAPKSPRNPQDDDVCNEVSPEQHAAGSARRKRQSARRLATSQQSPGPSPSSVNAPGKQNEACNSKGHETLAAVTSIHSSPSEATPEAELPAESTDVAESTLQEASTLRTCKRGEAWEDEETMHSHHGDSMQSESTITLD